MGVIKKQFRIGGMTCINCQKKIQRKLKNTAGIQRADVDYSTGLADITYDSDIIGVKDVISVIERLNYEVLPEDKKPVEGLVRTVGLLVIIVALYILLQEFGVLNLLVPSQLADTKMGYGMLFIIGLITSVHCIAMCGGMNLSQCIGSVGEDTESDASDEVGGILPALLPGFLYNLGRVISYTVIGFLLGLIGMVIGGGSGMGLSSLFQGILKLIAGVVMVIMGINMLGIFPWLRRFTLRMPRFLAVKIGQKKVASSRPLVVGLLNGLMPCGPLQSMQIVALASGNPFAGALSMLLFSLGTVPLMLGLGSLVSALGRKFSQAVMEVGAVLVTVLGLAMLSQGGSLSGLLFPDRLLVIVIMLCVVGVAASIPFSRKLYHAASVAVAVASMLIVVAAWSSISEAIGIGGASEADGSAGSSEMAGNAEIIDGVQVVNSTLEPGRYPDITVQVGIPVKWVINVPAGSINGCNYRMLLNKYAISHEFYEGQNVIAFTPTEKGDVEYTCWMGMIRGNIHVVSGSDAAAAASSKSSSGSGSTSSSEVSGTTEGSSATSSSDVTGSSCCQTLQPYYGGSSGCCGGGYYQSYGSGCCGY